MNRYLNSLLRKELLSINQTKNFIKVNRQIQRISGYCQTNKLFRYNFYEEKIVLNNILISIYEINLESNYDKKCASYGESLLNCYLDTLITLFDRHSEKDITKNFPFLNYPPSGENLELDVNFENLKLAFEFQGEYHYVDSRIQKKDKFKLSAMNRERRILIPVNVSQLQTDEIVDLILNAIINSDNIKEVIYYQKEIQKFSRASRNRFLRLLNNFSISLELYRDSFKYLDYRASFYISKLQKSNKNISATTPAPQMISSDEQVSFESLQRLQKILFKL